MIEITRVALPGSLSKGGLPTVIKKDQFSLLIDASLLLEKAREEGQKIIELAQVEAAEIVAAGKENLEVIEKNSYQDGLKKAQAEIATRVTELSTMTAQFFNDFESSLVEIVVNSVKQIVERFDDKELVLETVRTAANAVSSSASVSVWVSPGVHSDCSEEIAELVAPASVSLQADPELEGSQCRIDNGRVVIVGDAVAQVAAIRTALEAM